MPFEHYYVGGDPTAEQEKFMQEHKAAASMVGREAWPAAFGGTARQGYGLGSLVKKAFKAIKKIIKSPVGMAALAAFGLPALGKFGAAKGWAGFGPKSFMSTLGGAGWKKALMGAPASAAVKGGLDIGALAGGKPAQWVDPKMGTPSLLARMKNINPFLAIAGLSSLAFLPQGKKDELGWSGDYGPDIFAPYGGITELRAKARAGKLDPNEFPFLAAQGGRIGAQEGGLMDMGGMEKDYRQEGGFVPLGGEERADDVPARLSKNEFVFTADAVRAAGGGDIDAGAEVMENVMENLEQGGQVSEESQGLEGARDMFATAQRLEGVL